MPRSRSSRYTRRWLALALAVLATAVVEAQLQRAAPTVVTDLRVVQGATEREARAQCAALCPCTRMLTKHVESNWLVTGDNLYADSSAASVAFLCMRQDRTAAVARDPTTLYVLQSIEVFADAERCPAPLQLLFAAPARRVVVCMRPIPTQLALATGMYISNVTTLREETTLSGDGSWGWTSSSPTSVHVGASAALSLYLGFQRPLRPITGVRVLSRSKTKSSCPSEFGVTWEQAGTGYISEAGDEKSDTIVCVQRPFLQVSESNSAEPAKPLGDSALASVVVVPTTASCPSPSQEEAALPPSWKLCMEMKNATTAYSLITELKLVNMANTSVENTATATGWSDEFQLATLSDLNAQTQGVAAYLLYRSEMNDHSTTYVESAPTSSKVNVASQKPPLEARSELSTQDRARPLVSDLTRSSSARLSFKIVQLSDLHLTGDPDRICMDAPDVIRKCGMTCTELLSTAFVNDVLDEEQPDFVVFSGDTIRVEHWNRRNEAINAALKPVEDRKIPYAWIMGNHDDDFGWTREEIMDIVAARNYSYSERGPTTIHGVGNYELSVQAPLDGVWGAKGDTLFRMYFLDSNKDRDAAAFPDIDSDYDWIRKDQIEYYRNLSMANREANGPVPAIMFFHIPIPEYDRSGSVHVRSGVKSEGVQGPSYNSHLFSTLVELNEVKATFVGHDHLNEYCYNRQGIQLCYGGGAGFAAAYGRSTFARRARVIEWSINGANQRQITSWKRHFGYKFRERQLEESLYVERR